MDIEFTTLSYALVTQFTSSVEMTHYLTEKQSS